MLKQEILKPIPGIDRDPCFAVKWVQLETQQLHPGDWFPTMKSTISLQHLDFENEKSKYCVMADSERVMIASIEAQLFLEKTSDTILTGLQKLPSIIDYDISFLQDEYLKSL